ncbi:MAG: hypothetical protein II625_04445 [Bacilli bacterium]|nr:hypothetical protein [Bacilli bacterium]
MNLKKDKYIILEIIPTALHPSRGDIIQFSAIKLEGLNLLERFDYRLNEDNIELDEFKKLIDFDKEAFKYLDSTDAILKEFNNWSENLPLLIIDNRYTNNFLESLNNKKEPITKYLEEEYDEYQDQLIENLIKKYELEPTNYIVDILYESLIKHL